MSGGWAAECSPLDLVGLDKLLSAEPTRLYTRIPCSSQAVWYIPLSAFPPSRPSQGRSPTHSVPERNTECQARRLLAQASPN